MENNIEIINWWIWDDYYQRYFWKPLYRISSETSGTNEFDQILRRSQNKKKEKEQREVH